MLKKPESPGTPAIAAVPIIIVMKVTGMNVRSAPMRRMSCSPAIAWMTEPLPRNSSALKKAWVIS